MRHPHLTFAEHPMDKLSKNVVPEPVRDSPDPSKSQTGDKKYYSARLGDSDLREGQQLDREPTDTRYVLFASLERKNDFLIAVVVRFDIFEFKISFFLIIKARTKRIKCVSQTGVIFSRSCLAMRIWCEPHCVGAATPYASLPAPRHRAVDNKAQTIAPERPNLTSWKNFFFMVL